MTDKDHHGRLLPLRRVSTFHTPQEIIEDFWSQIKTQVPGKAISILPEKAYANKAAQRLADKARAGSQTATSSYEAAAAKCRAKVAHIVKECRRMNQRYCDPHFDLEDDFRTGSHDCLQSLDNNAPEPSGASLAAPRPRFRPRSVKRVPDIFDAPQFYIDGPTAGDVRQGSDADCWLMAALCTLSEKPGLIERVCVARDEAVGVYGFVFHRDGEWISEVVDDKLYLVHPNYDDSIEERRHLDVLDRTGAEEKYRALYQSNSSALYFAQCEHDSETWLPLLEKAYAKAHGDYAAIEGGHTGEGIEDLTGGVTSQICTADILDKDRFWRDELVLANKKFLFGCSLNRWPAKRLEINGLVTSHAYSVMRAVEMDGKRLVLLRNPSGRREWDGPWSDGSAEWTAAWIQKLDHTFGDDGSFWMLYEDLLKRYSLIDRTRLFGDDWKMVSAWTSMAVPWALEYNATKFAFSLARGGPVVLVLGQLDDRYFRGLEGQYWFVLSFRVHRVDARSRPGSGASTSASGDDDADDDDADDDADADYLVRSQPTANMVRSTSVELDLDAGRYLVLVRIEAHRDDDLLPAETVVRDSAFGRRAKLIRTGMAYDVAHTKGRVVETPAEARLRRLATTRRTAELKAQLREHVMEQRFYRHTMLRLDLKNKRAARGQERTRELDGAVRQRNDEDEEGPKVRDGADKTGKTEQKVDVDKVDVDKVKEAETEEAEKSNDTEVLGEAKNDGTVPTEGLAATEKTEPNEKENGPEPVSGHETLVSNGPDTVQPSEHKGEADASGQKDTRPPCESESGPVSDLDQSSIEPLLEVDDDQVELMFEDYRRGGDGNGARIMGKAVFSELPFKASVNVSAKEDRQREGAGQAQGAEGECTATSFGDPWNAIAVVGLRVYYQEVAGDAARLAAAEAAEAAKKAETTKSEIAKKTEKKNTKTTCNAGSDGRIFQRYKNSKYCKYTRAGKEKKAKAAPRDEARGTNSGRSMDNDVGARGDHVVQLWVERPHPFLDDSSDASSSSDEDENIESGSDDDEVAARAPETTLDMDDALKDATAV